LRCLDFGEWTRSQQVGKKGGGGRGRMPSRGKGPRKLGNKLNIKRSERQKEGGESQKKKKTGDAQTEFRRENFFPSGGGKGRFRNKRKATGKETISERGGKAEEGGEGPEKRGTMLQNKTRLGP